MPRPASAPTNQKLARCDGERRCHARQSEGGRDGQVNLTGDDHESHADGDDRHERGLPANVQEVVDRQEPGRSEAKDDEKDNEGQIEHPRPFAPQQRLG